MNDHPILGAVLFAIGVVLVGDAYYSSNGVLLVDLGCRQLERRSANAI